MKKICVGLIAFFSVTLSLYAAPCTYDDNGRINWKYKCSIDGKSGLTRNCKNWPLFVSIRTVQNECFEESISQSELRQKCTALAYKELGREVPIHNCDEGTYKIKKVSWEIKNLVDIELLDDGTEQGEYESLSSGKIKLK